MKKLLLLAISSLLCFGVLEAQKVKEATASMSKGEKNAFAISIPDIDGKGAETVWRDFIKQYKGKTRFDKKSGEWFTDDAKIPGMSDNTVDVYAILQERGKNAKGITVWFDLGGAYLSSDDHPDAERHATQVLQNFHLAVEYELAARLLANEEKKYTGIETDMKKLNKENEQLQKNIEKAKAEIAETEKKLLENEQLKEKFKKELENQEKALDAARKQADKLKRKTDH